MITICCKCFHRGRLFVCRTQVPASYLHFMQAKIMNGLNTRKQLERIMEKAREDCLKIANRPMPDYRVALTAWDRGWRAGMFVGVLVTTFAFFVALAVVYWTSR